MLIGLGIRGSLMTTMRGSGCSQGVSQSWSLFSRLDRTVESPSRLTQVFVGRRFQLPRGCWLEASVSHHMGLYRWLECTSDMAAGFPRASDGEESEKERSRYGEEPGGSHNACFDLVLKSYTSFFSSRNEALTPAHSQGEGT